MNMASTGVLLFIFTVLYICEGNLAFVNVQCTNKVGQHGQTSLLECVVIAKQDIADVRIRVVTWKKEGKPLLVFNQGELEQVPGYSFAEPSWNDRNMNVSLLIANTAPKDMGTYECMVMTNKGTASDHASLEVTAKYSAPTINLLPETGTVNADWALVCKSDGGYPEGRLRWFDEHNVEWTKSAKMEAKNTSSGLIQLSSKLTLFKGSIFSKYTCMVFNASGGKESEATYKIPDDPRFGGQGQGQGQGPESVSVSKIVAPLVVIGSLVVGLLLALLLYRRRSQQARRHSTAPLMGPHQEVPSYEIDVEEGNQEIRKSGKQEMDKECQDTKA